MFSILKWTPHHWVLFDDSHHSALPATTDIVECLGTSITNCIVLVTEPGTKSSTSKTMDFHGRAVGSSLEISQHFPKQKLMKVLIFLFQESVFLGHVCSCRSKICKQWPWQFTKVESGVLSKMVDHDKFHKIMLSCIKHPNIIKYHSRLTYSYHSKTVV